ncbi:MAG TPA: chorismate mutase [Chloroflexia bacterium]|nr:chorismate mutase [Chloroflexia bacterium]
MSDTDSPAALRCRGIRGATFVSEDSPEAILDATRELLAALAEANSINTDDIASVVFTTTPDLRSAFPARAARQLGWVDVPLLGATEMDNSDPVERRERVVRVLLHWNTSCRQDEVVHVYLRGAEVMRSGDPPTHLSATGHPDASGAGHG